jgi:hypothetical protein
MLPRLGDGARVGALVPCPTRIRSSSSRSLGVGEDEPVGLPRGGSKATRCWPVRDVGRDSDPALSRDTWRFWRAVCRRLGGVDMVDAGLVEAAN